MFTLVKMLSLSPKYLLYLFVNSFIDNNHRQRECTMNGLDLLLVAACIMCHQKKSV